MLGVGIGKCCSLRVSSLDFLLVVSHGADGEGGVQRGEPWGLSSDIWKEVSVAQDSGNSINDRSGADSGAGSEGDDLRIKAKVGLGGVRWGRCKDAPSLSPTDLSHA